MFAKPWMVLLSGVLFTGMSLADAGSDRAMRRALVGSWVMPPDTSDPVNIPSRQVFKGDGTTQLFIYTSPECRVPAAAIEGRWWIENGVLSTQITGTSDPQLVPVGEVQRVVIVTVEDHKIVFHADDQTYVREKSDTCFPPGAHRT